MSTEATNQLNYLYDFSGIYPKERMDFRHAIFEWCLRNAHDCFKRHLLEEGLRWDMLAGIIAHNDCSPLSSPLLESHLIETGRLLPVPEFDRTVNVQKPCRWLHVLNVAYPVGGHTAMATRWMRFDSDQSCHSVVLLDQCEPVPSSLADAVGLSNGEIITLNPDTPVIERAEWLRMFAWQKADVVVLHISPFDVISTVAFAVPGGPPVLLVNHAAHIFWVGCSIADFVLNCRGSSLEHEWTIKYRGIASDRSVTLPIPIPESLIIIDDVERKQRAKAAKESLFLPPDAKVALTVGNTDKYRPIAHIDFIETAKKILQASHDAYIIAVGIDENNIWKEVRKTTGGRLRAVGRQLDLTNFHAAADVYIEGFPFGSTTALMEAGLKGIPCVLAPAICPPPFTSDGLALEMLDRPTDLDDYVKKTIAFLNDDQEGLRVGSLLAESIALNHCGSGWLSHLNTLKKKLNFDHKVYSVACTPIVSDYIANYWSSFVSFQLFDPLALAFKKACSLGLKPKVDCELKEALAVAKQHRKLVNLINFIAFITGPISSIMPFCTTSPYYINLFNIFRHEGRFVRIMKRMKLIKGQLL